MRGAVFSTGMERMKQKTDRMHMMEICANAGAQMQMMRGMSIAGRREMIRQIDEYLASVPPGEATELTFIAPGIRDYLEHLNKGCCNATKATV